ncbi:MAG TPA: SGNH/GDSL hydrolase family protein [Pyrinomonadaceae bacterium]
MRNNRQGVGERPQSRASRRAKLLLALAGVVFGLLLAEVALRATGYSFPEFYTTDERRGYALRPGAAGWYRKEGASYVRINSDGLRDREHAREKPTDTFRIAVVGDSYAEALQVELAASFWAVMERRLQACAAQFAGGRRVEVINFGVSGYGTAQELITLRERVWDYSPDLVLLAFTTNNDITDNSRALKKTDQTPYFVLRDGRLSLDDSFRETRAFRLNRSPLGRLGASLVSGSRVVQLTQQAHAALRAYMKRPRAAAASPPAQQTARARRQTVLLTHRSAGSSPPQTQPTTTKDGATPGEELGIDNLVYRAPPDQTWGEAWRVTEELLKTMRDEVRGRGAEFLVVTLSNGIQVYPDPAARAAFMQRVGATDLFYPDARVRALGEREGFPVLNLAPALQEYADRERVFLHGFGRELGNGHWNELGHRVAGEMIAENLCAGAAR